MTPRLPVLAVLCLAFLAGGCRTWSRSQPIAAEYDKLWHAVREEVSRRYTIDEDDREKGTLETKWDERLSVYYLEGARRKIEVEVEPFKEDKDKTPKDRRWVVKLRCWLEKNHEVSKPLESKQAEWKERVRDTTEELTLIEQITQQFRTYGATDSAGATAGVAQESPEGGWSETPPLAETSQALWDAMLRVARKYYTRDHLLQPRAGTYESEWQPRDDPKIATQRSRLFLRIVEQKGHQGVPVPVHRVQVRVEQESLDKKTGKWHTDRRDTTLESALAGDIVSELKPKQ